MKRNIENLWRTFYVFQEGYYEIECPTVGAEAIFIASGHVKEFADKMVHARTAANTSAPTTSWRIAASRTPRASAEALQEALHELPCPICRNPWVMRVSLHST